MNIKHQELELERLEFKIKSKADLEILTILAEFCCFLKKEQPDEMTYTARG